MAWPAIMVVAADLDRTEPGVAGGGGAARPRSVGTFASAGGRFMSTAPRCILALVFIHVRLIDAVAVQRFFPAILAAGGDADRIPGGWLCRDLPPAAARTCWPSRWNNTGALLPVLPVDRAIGPCDNQVNYSLLLVCVGVLYAGLSITRKSFGFGVLAALAANGGLWYFFNRQDRLGLLRIRRCG